MENQLYLTNLYDYYKELLTEKQQNYFEEYYFDNLTMDEIAENYEVSKAVVSKTLIEIKDKLEDYEAKLHLLNNKTIIKDLLTEESFDKIIDYI